jgi:hypothetical protein
MAGLEIRVRQGRKTRIYIAVDIGHYKDMKRNFLRDFSGIGGCEGEFNEFYVNAYPDKRKMKRVSEGC